MCHKPDRPPTGCSVCGISQVTTHNCTQNDSISLKFILLLQYCTVSVKLTTVLYKACILLSIHCIASCLYLYKRCGTFKILAIRYTTDISSKILYLDDICNDTAFIPWILHFGSFLAVCLKRIVLAYNLKLFLAMTSQACDLNNAQVATRHVAARLPSRFCGGCATKNQKSWVMERFAIRFAILFRTY